MAPTPPTLVLTRPEAQSRALAAELGAIEGRAIRIVVAPIMEIACTGASVDLDPFTGVILTSANAVRCGPPLKGVQAFCVGDRTATAARDAGAEVRLTARDADDLVGRISGPGPLLHLRGEHARGAVADRLNKAGTTTREAMVYRQEARPLSDEARDALTGTDPVILPLFSPRSARLVGDSVTPGRGLVAIAMSAAVADAWRAVTGQVAEIASAPTGAAMRAEIVAALRRMSP